MKWSNVNVIHFYILDCFISKCSEAVGWMLSFKDFIYKWIQFYLCNVSYEGQNIKLSWNKVSFFLINFFLQSQYEQACNLA